MSSVVSRISTFPVALILLVYDSSCSNAADFFIRLTVFTEDNSGHVFYRFCYNIWFDLKITAIKIMFFLHEHVSVIKSRCDFDAKITQRHQMDLPLVVYHVLDAVLECCQRYMPKPTNIAELRDCFGDDMG